MTHLRTHTQACCCIGMVPSSFKIYPRVAQKRSATLEWLLPSLDFILGWLTKGLLTWKDPLPVHDRVSVTSTQISLSLFVPEICWWKAVSSLEPWRTQHQTHDPCAIESLLQAHTAQEASTSQPSNFVQARRFPRAQASAMPFFHLGYPVIQ